MGRAKPILMKILEKQSHGWFPELREKIIFELKTKNLSSSELEHEANKRISNEYVSRVCEAILESEDLAQIGPGISRLLTDQVRLRVHLYTGVHKTGFPGQSRGHLPGVTRGHRADPEQEAGGGGALAQGAVPHPVQDPLLADGEAAQGESPVHLYTALHKTGFYRGRQRTSLPISGRPTASPWTRARRPGSPSTPTFCPATSAFCR